MKQTDFEIGEELVERGEYDSAFCFFEAIATDPNQTPPIRADAYTWMGTLVRIMPSLGDGDECGLSFYKRALELHPDHVWAMLGIVETFGDHFPDHQDAQAFRIAMRGLNQRLEWFDDRTRKEITQICMRYTDAYSEGASASGR